MNSNLGEIASGNPKRKERYQVDTIKSVRDLYNSRQKIIDIPNDNSKIRCEVLYEQNKMKLKKQDLKY